MKPFIFESRCLRIEPDDIELAAAILARLVICFDAEVVEWEAFEIIQDFLRDDSLDVYNIHTLAKMVRATKFDEERNIWN